MAKLQVIAVERGYYGDQLREPEQEFTLENHQDFSFKWMEPAKTDASSKKLLDDALRHQEELRLERLKAADPMGAAVLAENERLRAELAALKK